MKKLTILTLSAILALGLLTGCSGTDKGAEGSTDDGNSVSGNIVVAGSTSIQPLTEELAASFMEGNGDIKVETQGGGSGVGIKSASDKVADIGASSRELKEEEKSGLKEYVIAKDGIAIIVNSECKVEDLSMENIKKIFTGEIKNWKEVGGDDQEIVVVSREEGSGTRGAFTEITGVAGKDASGKDVDNTIVGALVQPSTGAVKQTVSNTPNSIGYCSIGGLDDSVKVIKVDGVAASEEGVKDGSYGISRPFIYVTNGEATGAAKAFIDFVLSEDGQDIVAQDFVSIL